ncbi:galactosyltransferase-related protein [Halalkalibacter kiskunsagensis]|uniref:Galactosyltransferase-related protein n=1 Tax=Halalkalibacter kiskunsagensis TaxID=1548599 RepID=A0ABV6KBM0_9BACI
MESVSVLFPYKPDYGHRDRLFKWVLKYYKEVFPEVEICIGECKNDIFSRAEAVNNAAHKATKEIFVIADCDIFYDRNVLKKSIQQLDNFAWVVPYERIHYLSKDCTEQIIQQKPEWPTVPLKGDIVKATEGQYISGYVYIGGVNIVPRKYFSYIGGFDERFRGWGGEDDAFNAAMNTLCGHYGRLDLDIYHLWHPPAPGSHESNNSHSNFKENTKLKKRYTSASGNKDAMIQIVSENFLNN